MTLEEVAKVLNARVLLGEESLNQKAEKFCGVDMMSEALAFSHDPGTTIFTGLCNPQTIRTAEMLDANAVIFVRGKQPTDEMLELAQDRGLVIMTTRETMYYACGKVYHAIEQEKSNGR